MVKSLDILRLDNNTILIEAIGGLQEVKVMNESVCKLIRRGVNG